MRDLWVDERPASMGRSAALPTLGAQVAPASRPAGLLDLPARWTPVGDTPIYSKPSSQYPLDMLGLGGGVLAAEHLGRPLKYVGLPVVLLIWIGGMLSGLRSRTVIEAAGVHYGGLHRHTVHWSDVEDVVLSADDDPEVTLVRRDGTSVALPWVPAEDITVVRRQHAAAAAADSREEDLGLVVAAAG